MYSVARPNCLRHLSTDQVLEAAALGWCIVSGVSCLVIVCSSVGGPSCDIVMCAWPVGVKVMLATVRTSKA